MKRMITETDEDANWMRYGGSIIFKELPLDSLFHNGVSWGSGAQSGIRTYLVWRKYADSHAEVITQVGYGNQRLLGTMQRFDGRQTVWPVVER